MIAIASVTREPTPPTLADKVATYVSPLVIGRVARGIAQVSAPEEESFEGAALFADVAGFTALTEAMDATGPAGVEDLSRVLNACFTVVVDIIEEHGGLVVKFTGDGLAAVWRGGDHPARLAAQCALAIRARLATFPATGPAQFSLHAGVGAGTIHHRLLGGVGARWAAMTGGPAMAEAQTATARSGPGEVVLSRTAWLALGGIGIGGERADRSFSLDSLRETGPLHPVPRPTLPAHLMSALLPHVSPAIHDRAAAGQMSWLAEFRRVAVIFIHIGPISGHELRHLQRIVTAVQEVLDHQEATLEDVSEEPGGLTLIAAVGLPPLSHEDNAARATRIALALGPALGQEPCAVAVATGRLFCGSIGSETRRAYTMIGDTMNRCARLLRLATAGPLCDGGTFREARGQMSFSFLGTAAVRGKSQSVSIYRPLGERTPGVDEFVEMVGRREEREQLGQAVRALAEERRGGVIVIEGEAGIGKSTLVAQLVRDAGEAGVLTLVGAGDAIARAASYHAWSRVFQKILALPDDADGEERARLAGQRLARHPEWEHLAPLLNPVLRLGLPDNEITAHMNAQSRAEATTGLLIGLLRDATADTPGVVILEDCHWLDSASLALATQVRKQLPQLLLGLVSRVIPPPRPSEWSALISAATRHLRLDAVGPDDALEIVRRTLDVEELPPTLARLIRERAGGHPLFCEEMAATLRDGGHLVIEGHQCRLASEPAELARLTFPERVHGVVHARIDRLAPEERLVLKVASVIGRDFTLAMLAETAPPETDRATLPALLDSLTALGFTIHDGAGTYSFKHYIIQEVAYGLMVFAQRRQLHRAVAEWLEMHAAPGAEPLLAHHWSMAEVNDKAIEYLGRAGEQAVLRFANREAASFLTQAISRSAGLGAHEPALARGRWHRLLGEARFRLGEVGEADASFREAARILGFPAPRDLALKTVSLPSAVARQLFNRLTRRGPASATIEERERWLEAIKAFHALGEIAYFKNDLAWTIYSCIHALNIAERAGPSPALVELYASMMIVAAAIPPPALGTAYMRLAEGMTDVLREHPVSRAYVLEMKGVMLLGRAEWAPALAAVREASEIFTRFGNGRRVEECALDQFYIGFFTGDLDFAGTMLEPVETSARRREDAQTQGWARTMRAIHTLETVGGDEAMQILGDDPSFCSDRLTEGAYYGIAAGACLRVDDLDRAQRMAGHALRIASSSPPVAFTMIAPIAYCADVLIDALRRAPAVPEAARLARQSVATLSRYAQVFPIARPAAKLRRGDLESALGRPSAKHHRAALAEQQRLGMKWGGNFRDGD